MAQVTAVAWVWSQDQELPHAVGMVKKKKKIAFLCNFFLHSHLEIISFDVNIFFVLRDHIKMSSLELTGGQEQVWETYWRKSLKKSLKQKLKMVSGQSLVRKFSLFIAIL